MLEQIIHNGHSKVPSKLSGYCPVCYTDTTFDYAGMQETRKEEPMKLYHCTNCTATFEHNHLIRDYEATFEQADLIDPREFKESQARAFEKAKIKEMGYSG